LFPPLKEALQFLQKNSKKYKKINNHTQKVMYITLKLKYQKENVKINKKRKY